MKIKPEHVEHMRAAMSAYLEPRREYVAQYLASLEMDTRVKDKAKRYRWDLFNAAGLTRFACDVLYKYADDTHVDTALRAIMKDPGVTPIIDDICHHF